MKTNFMVLFDKHGEELVNLDNVTNIQVNLEGMEICVMLTSDHIVELEFKSKADTAKEYARIRNTVAP